MRLHDMDVTALDDLSALIDTLRQAAAILEGFDLRVAVSLRPGDPLMVVTQLDTAQVSRSWQRVFEDGAAAMAADALTAPRQALEEGRPAMLGRVDLTSFSEDNWDELEFAARHIKLGREIVSQRKEDPQSSTPSECHTDGAGEAESGQSTGAASTPAAGAIVAGDPIQSEPAPEQTEVAASHPAAAEGAPLAAVDPELQRDPAAQAPAEAPIAAGADLADDLAKGTAGFARWSELDISAAIQIYVDTLMLGGSQTAAYEAIGSKYNRTTAAVAQRFKTSWNDRAREALTEARKTDDRARLADAKLPPKPAATPKPDYADPLTQHLAKLPWPAGWSYKTDLDLVQMVLDGVDPATIAANLEATPPAVKARWDLLTGLYKDANDKLCRRWTGDDIRKGLLSIAAPAPAAE